MLRKHVHISATYKHYDWRLNAHLAKEHGGLECIAVSETSARACQPREVSGPFRPTRPSSYLVQVSSAISSGATPGRASHCAHVGRLISAVKRIWWLVPRGCGRMAPRRRRVILEKWHSGRGDHIVRRDAIVKPYRVADLFPVHPYAREIELLTACKVHATIIRRDRNCIWPPSI